MLKPPPKKMADGARFELALGVNLNTLSKRAYSTALPPIRRCCQS